MIRTIFYEPATPEKFRRNMKRRFNEYAGIAHFNAEISMAQRPSGELIYHVLDATVFVRLPSQPKIVGITANVESIQNDKIAQAKSLLEKISKVKLLEVH